MYYMVVTGGLMFKDQRLKSYTWLRNRDLPIQEYITGYLGYMGMGMGTRTALGEKKEWYRWLSYQAAEWRAVALTKKEQRSPRIVSEPPEAQPGKREVSSSLFVWAQSQKWFLLLHLYPYVYPYLSIYLYRYRYICWYQGERFAVCTMTML